MFIDKVKFFKNTKLEEAWETIYPDKPLKQQDKCANFAKLIELETKNWGIEYEKTLEIPKTYTRTFLSDIVKLANLNSVDILYDFKGDISMSSMLDIKIEENTFTRNSPLYKCCIIYSNMEFKIQGEISFKAAILNDETRNNILQNSFRTGFHTVLNKDYNLGYRGGEFAIDINVSSEAEKEKRFLHLINQE